MKKILLIAFVFLGCQYTYGQTRINNKTHEEKLNELYCKGLFKSAEGTIFDMEANPGALSYLNILDWLEGRVSGLKIYKSRTGVSYPYIRNRLAGVFVDEIQVSSSYLNAIPTSEIAMIKVIKTPFLGGFNASGGAIAIYTFVTEPEEE